VIFSERRGVRTRAGRAQQESKSKPNYRDADAGVGNIVGDISEPEAEEMVELSVRTASDPIKTQH
jgi:hypothetical protein